MVIWHVPSRWILYFIQLCMTHPGLIHHIGPCTTQVCPFVR